MKQRYILMFSLACAFVFNSCTSESSDFLISDNLWSRYSSIAGVISLAITLLTLTFWKTILVRLGLLKKDDQVQKAVTYEQTFYGSNTVHNNSNSEDIKSILEKIEAALPDNNRNLASQLLKNNDTINVLSSMLSEAKEEQTISVSKFNQLLIDYRKVTERLQKEIDRLKAISVDDLEYTEMLEKAEAKLTVFDNAGYQLILQDYRTRQKLISERAKRNDASTAYLQALSNQNNYLYHEALKQIDEALVIDSINEEYLLLKSELLYLTYDFENAIIIYKSVILITDQTHIKSFCYDRIGTAYQIIGKYDLSFEYYSKSVEFQNSSPIRYYDDFARTYMNIGRLYSHLADYERALQYLEKSLSILEFHEVPEINKATLYNDIGLLYKRLGKLDDALINYNKALTAFSDIEVPDRSSIYNNIGMIYLEKEDNDNALSFFNKSIEIVKRFFNHDTTGLATAYNNIGTIFFNKGDYKKSLEYYKKGYDIRIAIVGETHDDVASSYQNIALAYGKLNDKDKAIENYIKSLNILENKLGCNHPNTATTYNNIAIEYSRKDDHDKAIIYFKKSLAYRDIFPGSENRLTIQTRFMMIFSMILCNSNDIHAELAKLSVEPRVNAYNIYCVAKEWRDEGRFENAIKIFSYTLYYLDANSIGKSDNLYVAIIAELAITHCYNGEKSTAYELFEKGLLLAIGPDNKQLKYNMENDFMDCKADTLKLALPSA